MLKIEHIAKTFNPGTINQKKALRDLSLELANGDFVTVIGGNGAGKSTLLNILSGRLCPDSGTVTVDGAPAGSDAALGKLFLVACAVSPVPFRHTPSGHTVCPVRNLFCKYWIKLYFCFVPPPFFGAAGPKNIPADGR